MFESTGFVMDAVVDATWLAVLGGALALASGMIGSVVGIGAAASAGTATLAEDPKQMRNVLVLAAMPTTQTFYGLIILIYIVLFATAPPMSFEQALKVFAAALIGVAAEGPSAAFQGMICASGIAMLPKTKGKIFVNAMMLAVYAELIGILGLVFTILALILMPA